MSFNSYLDFIAKEQDKSPILKQGVELRDLYDLEYHYEQVSPNYSRKNSSSSVSTDRSSLFSLEQISKHSTMASMYANNVLISPPEDSKSVFRQILFDESEDEDPQFGYDHWNQILPAICHSDPFLSIVADEGDDEMDEEPSSSVDEETVLGDSLTNCQYPRQLVGLGISYEGDASDESPESDHLSFFVTLKTHKDSFCETVAERRKRIHKTEKLPKEDQTPVRRKRKTSFIPTIIPRSPIMRQAKLKAMKSLHEQPSYDSPSPTSENFPRRGKSVGRRNFVILHSKDDYCRYKYDAIRESYECLNCKTDFKRLEHLKRHSRSIHSNHRPYNCHLCEKSFARSDNLAQHLKVHQKLMAQGRRLPQSRK